jgi:type II restriction enzyme
MPSPLAEKAIDQAQQVGKAILTFISANDCGLTESHQAGFYLPRSAWELYAPFGPEKGKLEKSKVRIAWQGGEHLTDSVVTWYGQKTRDEYRLTSFGRGFPYLVDDSVGDLLVLIPQDPHNFLAYIIDLPEDIEDIQAALGVELFAVGVKTTCKDRWRQVTQEAPRVEWKHLITIQEGVSAKQLKQMQQLKVTLVVPQKLHSRYPQVKGVLLMDLDGFIRTIRKRLA